jgi:hypothetical protein
MENLQYWEDLAKKLEDKKYREEFFLQSLATVWIDKDEQPMLW